MKKQLLLISSMAFFSLTTPLLAMNFDPIENEKNAESKYRRYYCNEEKPSGRRYMMAGDQIGYNTGMLIPGKECTNGFCPTHKNLQKEKNEAELEWGKAKNILEEYQNKKRLEERLKEKKYIENSFQNLSSLPPHEICELGLKYHSGKEVDKDMVKATSLFKIAMENALKDGVPHNEPTYYLAKCYETGQGVVKDEKEAFKLYLEATNFSKNEQEDYECLKKNCNSEKEIKELYNTTMYSQRYTPALRKVGYCYESGVGIDKDEKKAVRWYLKAEHARDSNSAESNLAREKLDDKYKDGKWYLELAQEGWRTAQFHLGRAYFYGYGVSKSKKNAAEWYIKSAEQGYSFAKVELEQTLKYKENEGKYQEEGCNIF